MRHFGGQLTALFLALIAWSIIPVASVFSFSPPLSLLIATVSLALSLTVMGSFFVGVSRLFLPRVSAYRQSSRLRRLRNFLRRLFDSPVYVPGKAFFAYEDLLETLPGNEVDFLRQAREQAKGGTLVPGTRDFSAFIREMRHTEFRNLIRSYRLAKSRRFFVSLFLTGLSLIFGFSALYMVVHVFTAGQGFVLCPAIPSTGSMLEALYFSVATAATVGYGDIHPAASSSWAQLMAIIEIVTAFFFVAYSVNFGLSMLHSFDITSSELAEALRNELEDAYFASMIVVRKRSIGAGRA